jgi:hypothetical protein
MRMAIVALGFAGAVRVLACQAQAAVAVDATAIKEAASAASTVRNFTGAALGTTLLSATAK